jgi:hypothetical protein
VRPLLKVVSGLACLAVLGGCGSGSPPAQPGTPTETIAAANVAPGATLVRYELTGTAVTIDGTYAEPAGGAEKMVELRQAALPWGKDFTIPPDQLFVAGLVAQAPNLESTITCKIITNGTVVAQETGPTVDCRAEVI